MAIAYVQGNTTAPGGSGTTVAVAFPSNVTAGGLVVVSAGWGTADDTPTCADSLGNTYAAIDKLWNATNGQGHCTFYAKNVSAGACTVTVTFPGGSRAFRLLTIDEFSGADTTAPLDVHAIALQDSPGTGTDAVTSGNVTTTTNNQLVYGSTQCISNTTTITAGTGFTQRSLIASTLMTESAILATAGTTAATFTLLASRRTLTAVATFKEAAGGGAQQGAASVSLAVTVAATAVALLVGSASVNLAVTAAGAGALQAVGASAQTVSVTTAGAGKLAAAGAGASSVAVTTSASAALQARGAAAVSVVFSAQGDPGGLQGAGTASVGITVAGAPIVALAGAGAATVAFTASGAADSSGGAAPYSSPGRAVSATPFVRISASVPSSSPSSLVAEEHHTISVVIPGAASTDLGG